MNNPIEIFYCWQALVVALMVYMLTQLVKTILPIVYNPKTEKGKTLLKRAIMPSIPPILGFLGSALLPLHPEVLNAYVDANVHVWVEKALIFGAWGAAVGQFADYIYSKISKFLKDMNITPGNSDNS